ncbi:MAG TPA: hypothetical protein VMA95_20615 [Streptosporangiaceae bacterium]|nr:hypothetical protein [Streptosporangiaceae bacterium]
MAPGDQGGRTESPDRVKEVTAMEWHGIVILITTVVFGLLLRP